MISKTIKAVLDEVLKPSQVYMTHAARAAVFPRVTFEISSRTRLEEIDIMTLDVVLWQRGDATEAEREEWIRKIIKALHRQSFTTTDAVFRCLYDRTLDASTPETEIRRTAVMFYVRSMRREEE